MIVREINQTVSKNQHGIKLGSIRKKLGAANIDDSVTFPVPLVYRSETDHRNLSGLVVDIDDKRLFQIRPKREIWSESF